MIIKLSKLKEMARAMNNKKKLKSMKLQNIAGYKIYVSVTLFKYHKHLWCKCKLLQSHGSIQSFWVTNVSISITHQNDEVTFVTCMEDLYVSCYG